MMAEVYYDNIKTVMKYYGTEEEPLADFPFNFNLLTDFQNRSDVTGFALKASITRWLDNLPEGKWPNWEVRRDLGITEQEVEDSNKSSDAER